MYRLFDKFRVLQILPGVYILKVEDAFGITFGSKNVKKFLDMYLIAAVLRAEEKEETHER